MTLQTDIGTMTPARYIFKLTADGETIVCDHEPIEWKSGVLQMNRDLAMGGVFTSYQMESVTFIGNSAKFLRDLWNLYELNATCTLSIFWFKSSTREYVEFPSTFDINFNLYQVVKIGKFAFGIHVKAINSSVLTKIDSRQDINVDLKKLVSIGDFQIIDYPDLKKALHYGSTNVHNSMVMDHLFDGGGDLPRYSGYNCYASIPLNIIASDFTEARKVNFINRALRIDSIGEFFVDSLYLYENIDFIYTLNFYVFNKHTGTDAWTVQLIETDEFGVGINFTDLGSFGNDLGEVVIEGNSTISIQKNSSLRLLVRTGNIADIKAVILNSSIEFNQVIAMSDEKDTEGFPIYEAFERVSQHILDAQFPFYSEFFGRTDVIHNLYGTKYDTEDQTRFAHIQSGLNIRGALFSDVNIPLALNFKELFSTARAIWNVGYMIDSEGRIRVEEYQYFFQNDESPVLDLSGRINKYDIVSAAMPELVPVEIKSGFGKYEYLSINGRGEPNTTSQRTTIVNTNAKFDNISPFRGDTKGIIDSLNLPLDTTDTKEDSDIFIIKTQRGETDWIVESNENIVIEDDSSLFEEELMNRYFTPTRMLIRQGNRICAGFRKAIFLASTFKFQTSDKSNTLRTSGEGYTISENEDIPITTMDNPIYKPIKHTAECYFDMNDLEDLQSNLMGWIKFSDTISGYLLTLKKKNNEAKAEITIIEKI